MKLSQQMKWFALALALMCATTQSYALSLGRARGAAILGRPLELSVPVQLGPDEDPVGLCFEADVFYGDSRLDTNRVTVSSDLVAPGAVVTVRVLASPRIDEAVVSVYLRSLCGRPATRHYVLLTDVVTELSPPSVAPTPLPKTVTANVVPAPVDKPAAPEPRKAIKIATTTSSAKPAPTKPANPTEHNRRARLQLSPIDLTVERDPELALSAAMAPPPPEDLKKREEAMAVWRALNASPQDVLRDAARMQSMEGDLKALHAQTAKNGKFMTELEIRLNKSEEDRYSNPLVYGLATLLWLCLGLIGYSIYRARSSGTGILPWWRGQDAEDSMQPEPSQFHDDPATMPAHAKTDKPVLVPFPDNLDEVDIDLQLAESAFADLGMPGHVAASAVPAVKQLPIGFPAESKPDFAHSVNSVMREINTQEMLDVRQQAEFFMALGQYDEAIGVLKANINGANESNPLVYLDLIKVFHTLSQKTGFYQYREQFNFLFTGHVPEYANFNDQGDFIEAYPEVCEKIEDLWPSEDALRYIEKCLVREIGATQAVGFDLEAYRELLMLHGVVKRIVSESDSDLMPFSAIKSPVPSAAAPVAVAQPSASIPAPISTGVSIDFDLSEPEPVNNLMEFDSESFAKATVKKSPSVR